MLRRREQRQQDRIPAHLGQERGIDAPGPPGGFGVDDTPGEHVLGPHRRCRNGPQHDRAHRSTSATSRGLGTRSTASRGRPESGCRYTSVELGEAWPSNSWTSSMGRCCVVGSAGVVNLGCRPGSDRVGECGERSGDPSSGSNVGGEFVVAAAQVLHKACPVMMICAVLSVRSPRIDLNWCLSRP
jgi:hypothetical protein